MISVDEILRKRYPAREYALLTEVRDKAGFDASRSADYLVMNLWPSRGLHLSGIELKSSRSDWLSELKRPEKAENIFQYCDFFWLLTMEDNRTPEPFEIAKLEEIPPNWGWMAIRGGKVHIRKEAPKLEHKPISRHFLAALLKRASDKTHYVHVTEIEDRIKAAIVAGETSVMRDLERIQRDYTELSKIVEDFRKHSGIDLAGHYRWQTNPTKMGIAVKFFEDGGAEKIKKDLLRLQGTATDILMNLIQNLKALDDLSKPT